MRRSLNEYTSKRFHPHYRFLTQITQSVRNLWPKTWNLYRGVTHIYIYILYIYLGMYVQIVRRYRGRDTIIDSNSNTAANYFQHLVDETATGVMVPRAGETLPHSQDLRRPVSLHL